MLQKDDLGRLFDYTTWANHRVLRPVATLSVADFKRDLSSSHGGIRGTLTHMLSSEWLWLERWKGISPREFIDESEFPDVVVLRERWTVVEKHRQAWFSNLKATCAGDAIRYKTTDGRALEAPLSQLVQHVVNHATYHRGQVTALLRLVGCRAVNTDMVHWDREAKVRARRQQQG